MPNTISISLNKDLASLKDLKPGDQFDLASVCGEVVSNDGKTLTGKITEMECEMEGDSEEKAPEEKPAEKSMAMKAMDPEEE